jgi:hypothetical protein
MRMRSLAAGMLFMLGLLLSAPASGTAHGLRGRACGRDCGRDCCPPPPPLQVVLKVCHPCTGCAYDVAVCIPACCTDAPCVSHHDTLIGAGKTVYRWSSGHTVVVRFPSGGGYRVLQRG